MLLIGAFSLHVVNQLSLLLLTLNFMFYHRFHASDGGLSPVFKRALLLKDAISHDHLSFLDPHLAFAQL